MLYNDIYSQSDLLYFFLVYQIILRFTLCYMFLQVMLACEKYDLVHEFFQKMRKSFIPNSLTYKGMLICVIYSCIFHVA